MEARLLEVGDIFYLRGKRYIVKKVSFENGRVVLETTGGHLSLRPGEVVEVE